MFPSTLRPSSDLCLWKPRAGKSRDYRDVISFLAILVSRILVYTYNLLRRVLFVSYSNFRFEINCILCALCNKFTTQGHVYTLNSTAYPNKLILLW